MSLCRSCGARVIWARTAMGKAMPVDPRPNPSGNIRLRGHSESPTAVVLRTEDLRQIPAGSPLYVSHTS